ncbi:MAG: NAD(P)-dependent oxidoreductase [Cytophagales bacterium]|nr:NAD(P)-dependent oxidoreductase [Cytophagales bacterium]
MKILITGASGFIGGYLAEQLAGNPEFQILATGRSVCRRFDDLTNVTYFRLDLSVICSEKIECDICIHAAGLADDQSSEAELMRANVDTVNNLAESISNCQCMIHISSSSVYDYSDGQVKSETDATLDKRLSDYGKSKLLSEQVMAKVGIQRIYILRPRAVYGPGDRTLLPRIQKLVRGSFMIAPGTLHFESSLTHVRQLLDASLLCMDQSKKGLHVYNIADDRTYLLEEVFSEIAFHQAGHRKLKHIPASLIEKIIALKEWLGIRVGVSRQSFDYLNQHSVLSIEKAKTELGYAPKTSFFDSISEWFNKRND